MVMVIKTVTGDVTNDHIFNKSGTEFTYKITELKNKALAIESSTELYIDANGGRTEFQSQYNFIQ